MGTNTDSQIKWGNRRTYSKDNKKKLQKNSNEMEINNMPDKEFKEMVIRILNKLESRIGELRTLKKRVRKHNKKQSK